ncbi:cation:proton antiporter [uncultured Clostridium sp.]|uniref:cation:proton antiporter n=1 Tax=uncultured Clostridium sp. TaxID=59620 RepID=UPI00261BE6AC|nr:cation:proton antiporter [uncultured Clostridium sp.]
MHDELNYSSLLVISIIAFFTPFLVSRLKRLKIPYQVGEIIIGIVVGKTFLNIVRPDISILFLSNLGLAYLMFLSGLEINFNDLKANKDGNSVIKLPILMMIVSFIVAVILSYFGLKLIGINKGYLLFAFIFAASSPGLVVPILKGKNIITEEIGQIILTFSIICEFVAIIGTTVIFSISANGFTLKSFEFVLIFIFAAIVYLISKIFIKRHDFTIPSFKNIHLIVRAAFALILILVAVAEKLNTEIVLGAFLAGMIFSILTGKAKEEISHQLDIIGYGFLIPIFFIMVGVNVNLKIVLEDPSVLLKVLVLLIIFFLVKFIPSMLLKRKFGLNKAISTSMLLTAQLSLVIVSAQLAFQFGFIGNTDYSAFIITTIVSCILFPVIFEKLTPSLEKSKESVSKDIIIREVLLTNIAFEDKPLKDCNFPSSCRIFSFIRNDEEIVPNGNTILKDGDLLILVGTHDHVEETMELLSTHDS